MTAHEITIEKIRHQTLRQIGLHALDKKIKNVRTWTLSAIPDDVHGLPEELLRHFKNHSFSITYDFENNATHLTTIGINPDDINSLQDAWPGLKLEPQEDLYRQNDENAFRLDGFPFKQDATVKDPQSQLETEKTRRRPRRLENLFNALSGKKCRLTIGFQPATLNQLQKERHAFEQLLSIESGTRTQHSHEGVLSKTVGHTSIEANIERTDQTRIAAEILSMINQAQTSNDAIYNVSIYGTGANAEILKKMLETRYHNQQEPNPNPRLVQNALPLDNGEIMSGAYAAEFIQFSPHHAQTNPVVPLAPLPKNCLNQGVPLGVELANGIKPIHHALHLNPDALVLHGLITGLNGMGKTTLATTIATHCLQKKIPVITFSPDKEWTRLARASEQLYIIPLYDSIPFNLVRCPENTPIQQYYQNLALWLSKAMNAGPYTQPLMKTMLTAFTELYHKKREPSLDEVYDAIEAATESTFGIELATGEFKLDKYGHNIKSSLENLRQILLKQSYQARSGVKIEDCIKNGAVFDASEVSELLKPLFYAFLYSQIFSYALKNYDEKARNLRLLLCMEEAHLVFKNDEKHEAQHLTQDLENKLGLLRKRGVGLLFITHFADQLNESIQRYTQNKISFRQDAHSIDQAVKDLAFPQDDLKTLNKAKTKLLHLKPFEAAALLTDTKNTVVGPFFMKIEPQFIEPLNPDELREKTEALKKDLPPEPKTEPEQESKENVWETTTDFNDPYTCIQTLKAIGSGKATTARDLNQQRGIGKRYKNALRQLFDKQLIMKNRRASRTKNAVNYQLTPLGQQAYYYYHNEFPELPETPNPGENHTAALKAIREKYADFNPIQMLHSYANPTDTHKKLGIQAFEAKTRLDLVLERKNEKTKDILLIEYEVGTNNDYQLYTNLTKLVHNREGLEKSAYLDLITNQRMDGKVKALWIAKNQAVKERLLKLLIRYRAATHEHFSMTVATLNELLEGKDKEVMV